MSQQPSGAACAPSFLPARAVATRPAPDNSRPRRWWSATRDPGLDDRLLRDIGVSRAEIAALLL